MIIRSHKDKNFTTFSNSVLQNENLSWEARGMLCYLISLPENWETHVTELSNRSPAGYAKNKRILAELEASGHILRSQKRGEDGRFLDWIFDIYDEPQAVTDDAGEARRIIAEWAAMAARSLGSDPASSLVWACRNWLVATAEGDKQLPVWS